MHFSEHCLMFLVLEFLNYVTGQVYNLTGSSQFAEKNQSFTLTCGMFIPPGAKRNGVVFKRHDLICAIIGQKDGDCGVDPSNVITTYSYKCLSDYVYTLTIPAENMTEYEQKSVWKCEYLQVIDEVEYQSAEYVLNISIDVHNVSLIPDGNELTIREGNQSEVRCDINSNAVPDPTITWYVGSTDITIIAGADTTSIIITGNRTYNTKTLECRATNNDKPTKKASTTLNVEYPPKVNALSNQNITEGINLSVTCHASPGNPSDTLFSWTKVNNKGFEQDGDTLQLPDIRRTSSGTYICTAKNSYSNGEKGTESQNITVDVQYRPEVSSNTTQLQLIEGHNCTLECKVTAANPYSSITWKWFRTDIPNTVLYNRSTYTIHSIKRDKSGSYSCTASNSIGQSKAVEIYLDVQYKPEVTISLSSSHTVIEGQRATLECTLTAANPNTSITWKWFKTAYPITVLFYEPTYKILNVHRNMSDSYSCTAINSVGVSKAAMIYLDVQYKPEIVNEPRMIVNESDRVVLTRKIVSNPLSDVNWYDGSELVESQKLVGNASYIIKKATCTDTKNFTIVASNTVEGNVTALVELIVNCKPRSNITNITLGVTDSTGIEFSTTVIAYPEPQYELKRDNGTLDDQMMHSLTANAVNSFTIHFIQTVVNKSDFGLYRLKVGNLYGEIIVFVNVLPRRKPNMPENIHVECELNRAIVHWKSAFNGGATQFFTVINVNNGQKSDTIADKGENEIHSTYIQNLKPSTAYVFFVFAKNSHGLSASKNISCLTAEESSKSLPFIAGGAVAGGIFLTITVIVSIIFIRRYTKHEKQTGESQRFENDLVEEENTDDDGMKDNILYVSAGPKVDEKPVAAVYAAVNKKAPESNNNANIYAEVNKSGHIIAEGAMCGDVKPKKGLFKKDVNRKKDGNPKQKKGKKQKNNQDVADVYENSEDIPMSFKTDNVYSNAGQKVQNKEERGYKNKDGLLYVEVKFDAKTEKGNQTIHGEDEKTDYATVEFPMAASTHNE